MNNSERAAENLSKLAKAISFTAEESAQAAEPLRRIMYEYWGDIMKKFPKLNIDVCAECGNRCLFDLKSGKDHPCPLYEKSVYCAIIHFKHELCKELRCMTGHKWRITDDYSEHRICLKCGKEQVSDDCGMTWRNKKGGE